MQSNIIDDHLLNENELIINTFSIFKVENNLVIKTLKPKVISYIGTLFVVFLFGGFFLFLTIHYFISDGASLFLLLPLFLSLFCIIPAILMIYVVTTCKEKWLFTPNEIEYTSPYGKTSTISKNEVSSIYITVERRNTYGNIDSLISIHLKFNNKKTDELIQLDNSKKQDYEDALLLSKIISEFWGVPLGK